MMRTLAAYVALTVGTGVVAASIMLIVVWAVMPR